MKKVILLPILSVVITYLLAAFIVWDINPVHWTESGRFLCAIMTIMLAVSGAVFGMELDNQKINKNV